MFYDAITDFIFVEDEPQAADVIFVPGSDETAHALRAAALYQEGYAPYVLPSGKYSILKGKYTPPEGTSYQTECDRLCAVLRDHKVPESAILREPEATFTWENAIYSRRRTEEEGLVIRRAILCCQAYHARRCLLYYQQQFPGTIFYVCPAVTGGISRDTWFTSREGIDTVLGEVERCGTQFHEILADAAGLKEKKGETID